MRRTLTASLLFVSSASLGCITLNSPAGAKDQSRIKGEAGFAPSSTPQSITNTADQSSKWQIEVSKSKIDDSERVIISARADDPVHDKFGSPHMVTVVAACREQKTDFFITFGSLFMADIQGYGDVTLRLDKEKARRVSMTESTDHLALGLWNGSGIKFLKSMTGRKQMLIVATPYNESNVETTISLVGFDQALAKLRNACNW